ncbi:MAG TPA: tetratricopeptide repeat protein [Candidatus Saccharimonadales bacterium]|nr:tetratricopeptide repeat protein [Candidatus Saccharimonadales bacterium]
MEDNTPHIVTDDRATAWWRWFTRRVVLIPLCAVILVGIGAWVFFQMRETTGKKETAVDSAIKAADEAFQTGDYNKSLEQLQGAADEANTKEDKVALFNQLSAAAANAGKFQEAIDYMKQKHELDPSLKGQDAFVLGSYYEVIEDYQNAIQQYKRSIEYEKSQPKTQRSEANIRSLEVRISSLEESQ